MGSSVGENATQKIESLDATDSEFNLTPSMRSWLKNYIAAFVSGERACASSSSDEWEKVTSSENIDDLIFWFIIFVGMNIDEKLEVIPDEIKDRLVLRCTESVRVLEGLVTETKNWAQETALQAVRKASGDITELNLLRKEKDEANHLILRLERAKEMQAALKRENAELRAELEALKLSTSESLTTYSEIAKREKQSLKKHQAWEKQKSKLQEEIAVTREKNSEKEQQLASIEVALRELEVKCDEVRREKDLASSEVQIENRLKKSAETESRRILKKLRQKAQLDSQGHEDEFQRLKEELSKLKASMVNDKVAQEEAMDLVYPEFEDVPVAKACLFCSKAELSVVFLPCAHQVLCTCCNDSYGKIGGTVCPYCQVPIEQKIRIFYGTSS